MSLIAVFTILTLIIIGVFHIYWAFGGKAGLDTALPTRDGVRLLNPSKLLTFFVGVVLFCVSYIAYLLYLDSSGLDFIVYIGWMLSVLFLLRSIGEFNAVGFFKKIRNTPFAEYDTKYFSPLCLFLSIAFALLSVRMQ